MSDAKPRSKPSGCLTFIVVYFVSLMVMCSVTTPPKETKDFSGPIARDFFVVAVKADPARGAPNYSGYSLAALNSGKLDLSASTFLLPEKTESVNVGNSHRAKVLEDHAEWQLIEYYYDNTHMSTSRYRAYKNRIEPVAYQLTGSVVQGFMAAVLLVPALILTFLIRWLLNRRG